MEETTELKDRIDEILGEEKESLETVTEDFSDKQLIAAAQLILMGVSDWNLAIIGIIDVVTEKDFLDELEDAIPE